MCDEDRKARNRAYVAKSRSKLSTERKAEIANYYRRSWRPFITKRVRQAITEDKLRGRDCDISADYVRGLVGDSPVCALSGVGLRHDSSLFGLSIDRINNSFGHVASNIQLVCVGINLAKNRHSDTDVLEFISNIRDPVFAPVRFSHDYLSICARNASARRIGVVNKALMLELYERVGGVCPLTGIKLACYPHPMFSASIDRIDSSLGYVDDNVRLVIKAINRARGNRSDAAVIEWLDAIRGSSENIPD